MYNTYRLNSETKKYDKKELDKKLDTTEDIVMSEFCFKKPHAKQNLQKDITTTTYNTLHNNKVKDLHDNSKFMEQNSKENIKLIIGLIDSGEEVNFENVHPALKSDLQKLQDNNRKLLQYQLTELSDSDISTIENLESDVRKLLCENSKHRKYILELALLKRTPMAHYNSSFGAMLTSNERFKILAGIKEASEDIFEAIPSMKGK